MALQESVKEQLLPEESDDADPTGNYSQLLTVLLTIITFIKPISKVGILNVNYPVETIAKEVLDQYIEEDRESEIQQNRSTAKRVQQAILKVLRDELGVDEVLDETIRKELMLQVIYLCIPRFYDSKTPNILNTSTTQRYTFVYRVYINCGLGVSCKKWQLNTTMKVGPVCIFRVRAQTPRN